MNSGEAKPQGKVEMQIIRGKPAPPKLKQPDPSTNESFWNFLKRAFGK